jgi:hypothetical protein
MKTQIRNFQKGVGLSLILVFAIGSLGSAGPATSSSDYIYTNGIQIDPGALLPIFSVSSIPVNSDVTESVSENFLGIFDGSNPLPDAGEDAMNGYPRFTYLNEANNTLLEQFSATGGFYAYNPANAFGNENPAGGGVPAADDAKHLACLFLSNHPLLLPGHDFLEVPNIVNQCDYPDKPEYEVSTEWLTSQSAMATDAPASPNEDVPLRLMVNIPIWLHPEVFSPDVVETIPFGGPGGHISMIFYNPPQPLSPKAQAASLDPDTPGLQAIAMPAYGRIFDFLRLVPAADPADAQAEVLEQVQSTFPGGDNIKIPTPALEYYLTDASTPQSALEPTLVFSGVSVDVDGNTLFLKDIVLPGVVSGPGGLGPTVEILSPTNGSPFMPGEQVTLEGEISEGVAPYSYSWELEDGSELTSGTANASGVLPLFTTALPVPASKEAPGSLTIRLVVTDDEGITRQAQVSLVPALQAYLPAVMKGSASTIDLLVPGPILASPQIPDYTYTFGVEYGSDYPPYGPGGSDLGGVPGDANGFSSSMWGLGWPRIFNWYNALAWERDWRDCSLGGSDCTYGVDRTDFVYYSGHGNNGGISVPSNNHDSSWFDGINARYQNARWVGFSSCLTLRAQWTPASDAPIRRWFNAFQGAHMLLGFNSLMADIAFGGPLVDNMRLPSFFGITFPWAQRTIAQAWVQTAFQMNAGKPAYIYAWRTGVDPSTNKLPQVNDAPLPRPYPVQWFYWVWWDE